MRKQRLEKLKKLPQVIIISVRLTILKRSDRNSVGVFVQLSLFSRISA